MIIIDNISQTQAMINRSQIALNQQLRKNFHCLRFQSWERSRARLINECKLMNQEGDGDHAQEP